MRSSRARVSTTGRDAIAAGTPLGKPWKGRGLACRGYRVKVQAGVGTRAVIGLDCSLLIMIEHAFTMI